MRLFVAIELEDHVLRAAAALVDDLARRASRIAPRARIGWVTPERMHLTVRFIGEVDEAQFARIREVLGRPIDVPPFTCAAEGIGAFPPGGTPRVIWAGVGSRNSLLAVEQHVSSRLAPLGIAPEDRPYTPHLTLARVRDAAGLKTARLLDDLPPQSLGTTHVSAVTLFESRLSPKGPTYVPLLRTSLSGPDEAGPHGRADRV